jgi:hypothetical protein
MHCDILCLASATCSYNLPEDFPNLKRPEFLFHIDLFDPLFCTYPIVSIHDSSDSRVVVLVQVKQVATVNQHPPVHHEG